MRVFSWLEDRSGLRKFVAPVADHPVPPNTGWYYVFGSATLFAFLVQVGTGVALATGYVPSTANAYDSLQYIQHQATLGRVLRGMHYFGASAMVLLIGAHAVRTFLTGSFKYPREMSWLSGVVLLAVTLLMGFTGQLLRFDQNAVSSIVVAAEQAGRVPYVGKGIAHFLMGGNVVGGATLTRFFAVHVFLLPALIFAFVGLHVYLVLRNGISEPPEAGRPIDRAHYRQWYEDMVKTRGVPFWPDAAWRDVVFGFLVVLAVFLLALWRGAPELTKPPDPTLLDAHPRPDWYILWYYAVLALLPHGWEKVLIIGFPLVIGLVLVLLPFFAGGGERSPRRRPWAVAAVVVIVSGVGVLSVEGNDAAWSPEFKAKPLPVAAGAAPPVAHGAQLFHVRGCEYCHRVGEEGGRRGPDLTTVGRRLSTAELTLRIMNGGNNMPAFASSLDAQQLDALVAYLGSLK